MTFAGVAQSVTEREDQAVPLGPLQEVAASLRRARGGKPPTGEQKLQLLQLVPGLGSVLLPQLLRSLASDSDGEAHWAMQLLRRADLTEVTTRLRKLLSSTGPSDLVKSRALSLLSDLGVSPPMDVAIADPDGFIAQSVSQLLATIACSDDIRRTVDDLLTSVPSDELLGVMREVVRHGGEVGAALLETVMLDDRTPHEVAVELISLTRPTREGALLGKTAESPFPQPHAIQRSGRANGQRPSSPRSLLDALPVRRRVASMDKPAKTVPHDNLLPAVAALSSAQFDVAVELLTEVVTDQPEHHPSWLHLAVAHSALAQHRQAARCMRRAILLQSSRPNA